MSQLKLIKGSLLYLEENGKIINMVKLYRSSYPEVFLGKGVLKICSKFIGEHPCRSAISTKLLCSFIEIALWHGCSPVNLLHIFRTPFPKNTSGRLLLALIRYPFVYTLFPKKLFGIIALRIIAKFSIVRRIDLKN